MSSHRLTDRPPRCGKPHIHLFPADCCCFSELQFCLTLNCPGDFIHNHSAPCSQDVTNLVLLMLMEPLWSLVLCIFLIPKTLDDNRSTGEDVLEAADDFVRTFQTKSRKIFRDYFLCSINIWTPEICSFYGVQKFFFQLLSSINNLSFFKHTLNHIKYIKSNTWHHSLDLLLKQSTVWRRLHEPFQMSNSCWDLNVTSQTVTLKHLINVAVAPLNPLSLILAGLSGMNRLRKSSSSLPLSPSLALVSSKACCTCCGWVMSTWRRVRRCEQVLCSSLAPSPFRSNTVANTSKPRESRCLAVAFPKPESQPAGTKRAFFSSSCLFTVNIKLQSQRKRKRGALVFASEEKKKQTLVLVYVTLTPKSCFI